MGDTVYQRRIWVWFGVLREVFFLGNLEPGVGSRPEFALASMPVMFSPLYKVSSANFLPSLSHFDFCFYKFSRCHYTFPLSTFFDMMPLIGVKSSLVRDTIVIFIPQVFSSASHWFPPVMLFVGA